MKYTKAQLNLIEKVSEQPIELQMEILKRIQDNIIEMQKQFAAITGVQPVVEEVKYVPPVTEVKESVVETKEQPVVKAAEQKKGEDAEIKETKNNRYIKCGNSKGNDEVLFIEKRYDDKHTWAGQIRINNEVRNFHWSNQLSKPVVYGVDSMEALALCNDLIKSSVKFIDSKELTKYEKVDRYNPEYGDFEGRHYYDCIDKGEYIYLSPEFHLCDGDHDIICKGYLNHHAFVVRRDLEVFWRHYDFINMKKPFEHSPSKDYPAEAMMARVGELVEAVVTQFNAKEDEFYNKSGVQVISNKAVNAAQSNTNNNVADEFANAF